MHGDDSVRLGKTQHIVASLQRQRMLREALATKIFLRQVKPLKVSSRSTIQY